jgi:hypothetical protein
MSAPGDREGGLFDLVGPPENWVLPADQIEVVMLSGPCAHGLETTEACRTCLPRELFRRQIEMLALKIGCSTVDARSLADDAVDEHCPELWEGRP